MEKEKRIELFQKFEGEIKAQNRTVTSVAKECNISPVIMTHWRNGRSIPSVESLIVLTKQIGTTVEEFIA